jgi:hypothetical protein
MLGAGHLLCRIHDCVSREPGTVFSNVRKLKLASFAYPHTRAVHLVDAPEEKVFGHGHAQHGQGVQRQRSTVGHQAGSLFVWFFFSFFL